MSLSARASVVSEISARLDRYRLALSEHESAFNIVAFLLRDGDQSDAELAQSLGTSLPVTRLALRTLYRANFVHVRGDTYSLSEFGTNTASRFGLPRLAVQSLLRKDGVPDEDRRFLDACYRFQEAHSSVNAIRVLDLLRSWSKLQDLHVIGLSGDENLRQQIPYTILCGSDSELFKLGAYDYCNAVRHRPFDSELRDDEVLHFDLKVQMVDRCERAKVDFGNFDRWLLLKREPADAETRDSCAALTVIVIYAFLAGSQEPNFSHPARLFRNWHSDLFWQRLDNWRPGLVTRLIEALDSEGESSKTVPFADAVSSLRNRLVARLNRTPPRLPEHAASAQEQAIEFADDSSKSESC
jgi:hypothetical protein